MLGLSAPPRGSNHLPPLGDNRYPEKIPHSKSANVNPGDLRIAEILQAILAADAGLQHVDLSNNELSAEACKVLLQGLENNHSLCGLHLRGNRATLKEVQRGNAPLEIALAEASAMATEPEARAGITTAFGDVRDVERESPPVDSGRHDAGRRDAGQIAGRKQ